MDKMSFLDIFKKLLGGKKDATPAPSSPSEAQGQQSPTPEPSAPTPPPADTTS